MCSDWTPQVAKILNKEKHPNADNLSIYTVLGDYPVIDRTDKFNVGDLAVYLPIDTIVPDTEQWHWLCPRQHEKYYEDGEVKLRVIGAKFPVGVVPEKFRLIKAKKIRQLYSQGLLDICPSNLAEGDSVVELMNLSKMEEEEEENLPSEKGKKFSQNESPPKGWKIPYYDISSVRKYLHLFRDSEEIVLLEKDHGCNFAACFDGEKLWVKSRNYFKRPSILIVNPDGTESIVQSTDIWNEAARHAELDRVLRDFPMKVFFAECVGANKGFRYDAEIIDGHLIPKLHFFDVYDPISGRYFDYDDGLNLILKAGLTPSRELYRGAWLGKEKMYEFAEGKSTWNINHCREGWVMKSTKERFEMNLNSRFQLKLIGATYNLQK